MRIRNRFLFTLFFLTALTASAWADMSLEREISLGRETARKVEAQYGLWPDGEALERVNRIGHALAAVSERPDLPYTFKVLNTTNVNALAVPGGFIYTTRGLMSLVTDDELAFVLGHEITHAAKKHTVKQIEKQNLTNAGLLTLAVLLGKGEPSRGTLNTAGLASTVLTAKYSRDDEKDADLTACQYMSAIGINPRASITFMEKLKKYGGGELPGIVNSLVGSHPNTDQRIAELQEECERLGY